jgi:hypothetical protein
MEVEMAFTRTWNASYEATPDDDDDADEGAARIRDLKEDIRERLDVDHSIAGDSNDGLHKHVTLIPQSSKPVLPATMGGLYVRTIAGNTVLCYEDAAGAEIQLTNIGLLLTLPAVGIDDQTWYGITEEGTAGEALVFGQLCYFKPETSQWKLVKADAASIGIASLKLGVCILAASGVGEATAMLLWGKIRADSLFDPFDVGLPLYISAATAGKIVSAAPTGTTDFTVRKVGFANSADEIFFCPSNDYITLA